MSVRAAIIVRLSREDLNQPGSAEEKVARHLAIAQDLAKRHDLPPIQTEDIYTESGISGRRLSKRPDTLRMLDRCRTGYYTHVVTAYQSRILRGDKRDEADVEDAFLDGCITLITSESVICFDDTYEASNALVFEIRAAADRNYLRDISKKLKESNRQRTLLGRRSGGMAPYGYFWKTAAYDQRKQIDAAHHEVVGELEITDLSAAIRYAQSVPELQPFDAAKYLEVARRTAGPDGNLLPGVVCSSGEYAVLCEIFARIRCEGYTQIVRALNQRGIPTAGASRFREGFAAMVWHDSTVRTIIRNFHYSGFPAHTVTTDRKGRKVKLPTEKHILPNEEQMYPHPIRLPDHRALLEQITARATPGSVRPQGPSLLTGLLKCSQGRPCRANSTSYQCRCDRETERHLGSGIRRDPANRVAISVLREALSEMPTSSAPAANQRPQQTSELITIDREIAGKKRDLADLQRHAATFARSGGADAFAATISALRQEIGEAERKYKAILSNAQTRQAAEALSALNKLRGIDFEEFWSAATIVQQRSILRLVIAELRIVPQPDKGRRVRTITITVQPWITPYYNPGAIKLVGTRRKIERHI